MFYCQHVLGMGHFIRSAEIVRGLSEFDVYFLNGGELVPGFELPAAVEVINLPALRTDAGFSNLYVVEGAMSLEQIQQIRRQRLLDEYERLKPDLLVIEMFPFGRLKFASELLPLLEQARADRDRGHPVKVVCSLRDILVGKREQQQFEIEACRIANRYFDLLLVHSDPRFHRLEETFSRRADLTCAVRYTGLVAPAAIPVDRDEPGSSGETILVSIGGGRVGSELIDCAVDALDLISDRIPHRMSIFTGPYLPEPEFQRLQSKVEGRPRIRLGRYTTSFRSQLKRADLSISMAGYNTSLDLITTGTRAIVYPFTGNNNREQSIRADKLRRLGLVEIIDPQELRPDCLADRMLSVLSRPKPVGAALDLRGVEKTALALTELSAPDSAGAFSREDE